MERDTEPSESTPQPGRGSRLAAAFLRELALIALFAILAVGYTWPLARYLDEIVSDAGDPLLNTWILDWVLHALAHQPLHLFDAPMFAGSKFSLAFSENLVGIALLVWPFKLAGFGPIAMHNIAMLAGFTLAGYGMTVLARTMGASLRASIVAAISFAFCQFFFDHLAHLQIVSAGWLPLMFAALVRLLRRATWPNALMFAAAFAMNGLTNIYWLLFGGFTAGATVLLVLAVDRDRRVSRLIRIASGFAIGAAILLPFLIPYRIVAEEYGMKRNWSDVVPGSATLSDYMRSTPANAIHGSFGMAYVSERQLATGLLPLLLLAAAIFLARRPAQTREEPARVWPRDARILRVLDAAAVILGIAGYFGAISQADLNLAIGPLVILKLRGALMLMVLIILGRWSLRLPDVFPDHETKTLLSMARSLRTWPDEALAWFWIIVAGLGSFGANSILYGFLFAYVEPFRAMRVPARWSVIVFLGLAVLAARGADRLLARSGGWRVTALYCGLVLFALADTAPRILWTYLPTERVPVYDWLKTANVEGPIFELPMSGEGIPYAYLVGLAEHRVPLINGTSGFSPPWDQQLQALSSRNEFNDVFLSLLRERHARLIIVHGDHLAAQKTAVVSWIDSGLASGDLALVRHFDRGVDGDWVFAVSGSQPVAETASRDAAGFTDRENWNRFARGESVYSNAPMLRLDSPVAGAEMHRQLTISGWALSPAGVKTVEVFIHGRALRFEARKTAGPEIAAAWPWYVRDPQPRFIVDLPKRPKGIPKHTSVQVRITDAAGHTATSDDRFIVWH
jgi:hypothetical protein